MKIGAPKESAKGEARVALTPDSAQQLHKLGHECLVEAGAGAGAGFSDEAYRAAGVTVVEHAEALWQEADVVVKVREPSEQEAQWLREGQTLIAFFWPAQHAALLETCKAQGATVIAMDMVPRISRAQKMDALSSMANIAGYRAVIEAGNNFGRFFTGQVTAAGKVPPAKVLVIGAGVAGLAAIVPLPAWVLWCAPSMCARKFPSRSSPWAPSFCSSISKTPRTVRKAVAMPRPPALSFGKSSWHVSARRRPR